jgi:hypothetical protein
MLTEQRGRVIICSTGHLSYVKVANDSDVTYTEALLGVWSIVKVNLDIMCGAAMRLKPLLVRWMPQLGEFSSSIRTRKSGGKSTTSFESWGASKELCTDPRGAQHT